MRTIDEWFAAYQVSHRNPKNKAIHFVCVPAIMWSVFGLLYNVRLPSSPQWYANAASVIAALGSAYYIALSPLLGVVMVGVSGAMLGLCFALSQAVSAPLWAIALVVFVAAWAGQFYGHKVEGKNPSFLEDLQFLLIGPLWVLAHVMGRTGRRPGTATGTPPTR